MLGRTHRSRMRRLKARGDDVSTTTQLRDLLLDSPEAQVQVVAKGSGVVAMTPTSKSETSGSFQGAAIVILCFLVTVICALDRAAMSVAILPMSDEFGYSDADKGIISSAYFWGYVVSNVLSGILGTSVSPKMLLAYSVVLWSIFTVLTPASATVSLPVLLACRALMGFCEGTCLPTMQAVLLNWVPREERSRANALVTSGITVGTVGSMFFAPMLVNGFGWPSVFFVFGATGFAWMLPWGAIAEDKPKREVDCVPYECEIEDMEPKEANPSPTDIPWRDIFQSSSMQGVIACTIAHNTSLILMLSWLPTYFSSTYGLDVTSAAAVSAPPWICKFIFANVSGVAADMLVQRGYDIGTVRRGFQFVGSIGPSLCLLKIASGQITADEASFWFTAALGLSGCALAGFNASPQDMARRYAPVLFGTFNAIGSLAGSLAVYLAGLTLEANPDSGFQQIFYSAVVLYWLGAAAFLGTYRGKQEFA